MRFPFGRSRRKRELDEEIQSHLAMAARERIERGESPEDAPHAARREFGNETLVKETTKEMWGWNWLEALLQDVRYGLRMLGKNRGFAIAAFLTMAIGIGANTAVFSIVDSTLFFRLPYPHPGRIVFITVASPRVGLTQGGAGVASVQVGDWKKDNHSFEAIAAYDPSSLMTLTGAGAPERIPVAQASPGFFRVLETYPALGRAFTASDERPGESPVAILSNGFWRARFGARRSVLGKSVTLNNNPYRVVGVMPADFEFPNGPAPDLLLSFPPGPRKGYKGFTSIGFVRVLGRLKPDARIGQAQADLDLIRQRGVARMGGGSMATLFGSRTIVTRLRDHLVGPIRPVFLAVWAAAGLLLLIACVNVANLTLARGLAREKEIALRVALGAHRRRVLRQLLTESMLLAALGGLAGIGIAYGIVVLTRNLGPADIPRLRQAAIDLPVFGFTLALAAIAGVLAGLMPARAAWRLPAAEALKEGGRATTSRGHRRLRGALVTAEIAMALVLAVASGLLIRSFLKITALDLGLDPQNILTAKVALPRGQFAGDAARLQFLNPMLERLERLPGVESASVSSVLPMSGFAWTTNVKVLGGTYEGGWMRPAVGIIRVTPGYFRTMRIPVVEGRAIQPSDYPPNAGEVPVRRVASVVNQAFSKRYFPGKDPIGQQIQMPSFGTVPITVVGVAHDIYQRGPLHVPMPAIYLPCAVVPPTLISIELRTTGNPLALVPALRAKVKELDPNLPVYDVATMDHLLSKQVATPRFNTALLTAFALIALVLAALGVYGVISYAVSEQTHEIGIRMALGAEKSLVLRMIVGKTLILALVGIGIGIGGALAVTRYLRTLLYQIRPDDPWSFAIAAVVLLAAALLAGFVPARRAMKVDPVEALRNE